MAKSFILLHAQVEREYANKALFLFSKTSPKERLRRGGRSDSLQGCYLKRMKRALNHARKLEQQATDLELV